jgi:predicted GNAT family N-acyltransferase
MNFSEYKLFRVTNNFNFKPFNCDDKELEDFLFEKSKHYQEELLATTFVLEDETKIIAYYSIFNDSIKIEDIPFSSKNALKTFIRKLLPHPKRYLKYYPAINIGRLATSKHIQKSGLGTKIMNEIIKYAIEQNEKCACKFIIVDAYSKSTGYYEKMKFNYFTDMDLNEETRQMYLDLTPYINAYKEI